MVILENDQLTSLSGIENMGAITQQVFIAGNEVLTDLCALQVNIAMDLPEDGVNIINNQFNPTLQDIIDGDCSE